MSGDKVVQRDCRDSARLPSHVAMEPLRPTAQNRDSLRGAVGKHSRLAYLSYSKNYPSTSKSVQQIQFRRPPPSRQALASERGFINIILPIRLGYHLYCRWFDQHQLSDRRSFADGEQSGHFWDAQRCSACVSWCVTGEPTRPPTAAKTKAAPLSEIPLSHNREG